MSAAVNLDSGARPSALPESPDTPAPVVVVPPCDPLAEVEAEFADLISQPWLNPSVEDSDARRARDIHLRRQLEAAAEHGAAMLAALGLPQLAALDNAIATLDALDGDPDLEEDDPAEAEPDELSLGWPEDFTARLDPACAADPDAEHDDADLEEDGRDKPPSPLTWVLAGRRAIFGAFDGEATRG